MNQVPRPLTYNEHREHLEKAHGYPADWTSAAGTLRLRNAHEEDHAEKPQGHTHG